MAPAIIFNLLARINYPSLLHLYLCIYQPLYVSDNLNCLIIRGDSESLYSCHVRNALILLV